MAKFGGSFQGSTDVGGGVLSSNGASDGFVAAYDSASGSHQWSMALGGNSASIVDEVAAIAVDRERLCICGEFGGTMMLAGSNRTSSAEADMFLVSLAR